MASQAPASPAPSCAICKEPITAKTDKAKPENCPHVYCYECIQQWSATSNSCPQCRVKFTVLIRKVNGKETKLKVKEKDLRKEDGYTMEDAQNDFGDFDSDDENFEGFIIDEAEESDNDNDSYELDSDEARDAMDEVDTWGGRLHNEHERYQAPSPYETSSDEEDIRVIEGIGDGYEKDGFIVSDDEIEFESSDDALDGVDEGLSPPKRRLRKHRGRSEESSDEDLTLAELDAHIDDSIVDLTGTGTRNRSRALVDLANKRMKAQERRSAASTTIPTTTSTRTKTSTTTHSRTSASVDSGDDSIHESPRLKFGGKEKKHKKERSRRGFDLESAAQSSQERSPRRKSPSRQPQLVVLDSPAPASKHPKQRGPIRVEEESEDSQPRRRPTKKDSESSDSEDSELERAMKASLAEHNKRKSTTDSDMEEVIRRSLSSPARPTPLPAKFNKPSTPIYLDSDDELPPKQMPAKNGRAKERKDSHEEQKSPVKSEQKRHQLIEAKSRTAEPKEPKEEKKDNGKEKKPSKEERKHNQGDEKQRHIADARKPKEEKKLHGGEKQSSTHPKDSCAAKATKPSKEPRSEESHSTDSNSTKQKPSHKEKALKEEKSKPAATPAVVLNGSDSSGSDDEDDRAFYFPTQLRGNNGNASAPGKSKLPPKPDPSAEHQRKKRKREEFESSTADNDDDFLKPEDLERKKEKQRRKMEKKAKKVKKDKHKTKNFVTGANETKRRKQE